MTQQQQEYLDNILTILVYMLPNDIKDTTLLEEPIILENLKTFLQNFDGEQIQVCLNEFEKNKKKLSNDYTNIISNLLKQLKEKDTTKNPILKYIIKNMFIDNTLQLKKEQDIKQLENVILKLETTNNDNRNKLKDLKKIKDELSVIKIDYQSIVKKYNILNNEKKGLLNQIENLKKIIETKNEIKQKTQEDKVISKTILDTIFEDDSPGISFKPIIEKEDKR